VILTAILLCQIRNNTSIQYLIKFLLLNNNLYL